MRTIPVAIGVEKDYLDRVVHFDPTRHQQQHVIRRGRSQAGFDIHRFLLNPPLFGFFSVLGSIGRASSPIVKNVSPETQGSADKTLEFDRIGVMELFHAVQQNQSLLRRQHMADMNRTVTAETLKEIRIVGLNRDLTRKTENAETRYEVFFDLSGVPSLAWGKILMREWKRLNPTEPRLWKQVSVDKALLVMLWPPQEIAAKHLPILKLAVAATNKTHKRLLAKNGRVASSRR
jgi:hypothetical protein